MSTIELRTQSFVLDLDEKTLGVKGITLTNEELREEYEDDTRSVTKALIRELALNLYASRNIIKEDEEQREEAEAQLLDKISQLEDNIEDLMSENHTLRTDNDMLRDELDAS